MIKTLSLQGFFHRVKNSETSNIRGNIKAKALPQGRNKPFFGIALLAINGLLLLNYILGVNSYAAKGYEMKKLQTRLEQVAEENKKLSLQVSESSSIVSVQALLPEMNFVAAGTPKFLQTAPVFTAMK